MPHTRAVQAINEGASKIIILPVFVTESTHTIAGTELIESVKPEKYGVQVQYTGALGNSDSLQNVFVDRAETLSIDYEKSDVGVLLVGHGQPNEWEDLYPEQNRQESEYRQGIKDKLVSQGFSEKNIEKCWMSFQKPTITESALELLD